jgi:hypothetical protein
MKPTLTRFEPRHARIIFDMNRKEGFTFPLPEDVLVTAYSSPGSVGRTMMLGDCPIACGGIMRMAWNIGEAWVLTSPPSYLYRKTMMSFLMKSFPELAEWGSFRRVQATCFDLTKGKLFELLGFQKEGILRCYGPLGEDALLFSRLFQWGA